MGLIEKIIMMSKECEDRDYLQRNTKVSDLLIMQCLIEHR
jgi:hypothetical protein